MLCVCVIELLADITVERVVSIGLGVSFTRSCQHALKSTMCNVPTCSLQCQEVGRRKGVKELVVIWAYSVDLVRLV